MNLEWVVREVLGIRKGGGDREHKLERLARDIGVDMMMVDRVDDYETWLAFGIIEHAVNSDDSEDQDQ